MQGSDKDASTVLFLLRAAGVAADYMQDKTIELEFKKRANSVSRGTSQIRLLSSIILNRFANYGLLLWPNTKLHFRLRSISIFLRHTCAFHSLVVLHKCC
jgi:hypothetical protein